MNHPETHLITPANGPRPAGSPDECFYCRLPLGKDHAVDCVCRKRTVVLRYTYEVVVEIPESWETEDIMFHRNEGSWCADSSLNELERRKEDHCLCHVFEAEYVREATAEDEKDWELTVSEEAE